MSLTTEGLSSGNPGFVTKFPINAIDLFSNLSRLFSQMRLKVDIVSYVSSGQEVEDTFSKKTIQSTF